MVVLITPKFDLYTYSGEFFSIQNQKSFIQCISANNKTNIDILQLKRGLDVLVLACCYWPNIKADVPPSLEKNYQ